LSCLARLAPQAITFPAYNKDEWRQGNRKTTGSGVPIEKLLSHDLFELAPDVEELVRRFLGFLDQAHFVCPSKRCIQKSQHDG